VNRAFEATFGVSPEITAWFGSNPGESVVPEIDFRAESAEAPKRGERLPIPSDRAII
jgi:hypothetical protein